MNIRVVSKRVGGTKAVAGEIVINIARPSILGNPFHMATESQRAEVVAKYRVWLEQQYQASPSVQAELHRIAKLVKAGNKVAVECWCAPCACHGDVVVEAVKAINNRPEQFKLIVAGGRDFTDYNWAKREIIRLGTVELKDYSVSIVCGMARGADAMGLRFAQEHNVVVHKFHADWDGLGKAAGHIRNKQMGDFADGLLAFWDGKSVGTKSMIEYMQYLGKDVRVIEYGGLV